MNNNYYIITEASGMDPVEKMRLFDSGQRDSNLKAMSDTKLANNRKICIDNTFKQALTKIEDEMIYRHLIKSHSLEALLWDGYGYILKYITPENFLADQFKFVKANLNNPDAIWNDAKQVSSRWISNGKYPESTHPSITLFCAYLYSLLLGAPQATIDKLYFKLITDWLPKLYITEDVLTIFRYISSEVNKNEAIKAKLTKFLDGDFTESLNKSLSEDIEAHNELNPKLWEGKQLKAEVKEKIDQIVHQFLKGLENDAITMVVKDVILIGSNCSYNYTKDSDLDIHIIAENIEAPDDLYNKIYSAYRSIFNGKFDIDFYGIPVEIYVETEGAPRVSNGAYSVQNSEWITEPVRENIPEIDKEAFEKELKIWEDRYKEIVADSKEELKESSTVLDSITLPNGYYIEYSVNKDGEYKVSGGWKDKEGFVTTDINETFYSEEQAKRTFKKYLKMMR